uniref:Uncharacterized protein n=1 Tax=Haptolina brevifila TaxID=156173 RepID=A0A7S2MIZ3_9EUKA|mmetsp:Transcript_53003/g.105358  ORF Transcript_53003/g.105358 Transcript_53003/m.105358 type:complete len:176 (+) Transcript_53003:75-602(+)|eukprot:CAMPEP_0174734774 /NCGR_PEP_ID=MMETSP1094-20130205/63890_1 /TAXON_ID=156173 /ORGANISM="Chrysochromulina brevifilum, Strain UTEX LB 985" /LENGTH=175 /DNA_ID=CAMNT_0015937643 /DNA_START=72 /DNA_END=599 /DNA_ORIENTATION=+
MGGKNNKPPHKSQMGGGGPPIDEEAAKPFHSKEFEQAQLDALLNAKERLTWDEFKEQQRKKGEMEGAESRAEEEAQRRFRQELDEARNARLGAKAAEEESKKSKKKHKKHKKEGHKKKKRRRDDDSEEDDSEDSEDEEERRRKKKSKKEKKEKSSKADGPVSLRAFFAGSSDEDD